jgi:RNA polymerase sigma-70 factor (ECF subfamily)
MLYDMRTDPLLQHLDAFIGFARQRTGDAELAADLVQECLMKALKADHVPEDAEGVVTWFYRVLRHAIIDAHRRRTTRDAALEKLVHELPEALEPEDERTICQCVMRLLPALPEADAELLRRIDLGGETATEVAAEMEQRVNTINVRLLRARKRLREQVERVCRTCATHGCLDCDCG